MTESYWDQEEEGYTSDPKLFWLNVKDSLAEDALWVENTNVIGDPITDTKRRIRSYVGRHRRR